VLGLAPRQRSPKDCVEQWVGISTDEYHRIFAQNNDRMTFLRYPLIEMNMSRVDCQRWLMDNYKIVVPKSACVGCPFRKNKDWKVMPLNEFKDACEFDRAIRGVNINTNGKPYLHSSCVPLEDVDFRTPHERLGQLPFDFFKDEKLNLFVNNLSI
jgi:hypothetical protein